MDNSELLTKSNSEDEFFFGAVTDKEKKKAHRLRNRKTEIFEAPLRRRSVNMAPHDDSTKTYSKVPNILTATESEKKQRIKQRSPPLPPFNQLYCTKDGESLNSPFHLMTNTKNHIKTLGQYMSERALMPLLSPHVLSLPVQQLGRLTISPGLSPSFYYDPFDKLLRSGYVGTSASSNISPSQYTPYPPNTSCSSVEDIFSPAGLLFCSPMPQKRVCTLSRKKKKLKAKKDMKKTSSVVQSDNNMQENKQHFREHISNRESTQNNNEKTVNTPNNINIYKENIVDVIKTPDLFFTSSWVTRRKNYERIGLVADMNNNKRLVSSIEKAKLKRSFSVPEIHVLHPEESDNSFMMSPSFTSNPRVSDKDSSDVDEEEDTTTKIPVPTWLLTIASALNNSP